ncbi:MAG: cyclic nucleotide-binding domain-containing protein [Myxococcales bacterium]|nr:cyclic nucleotide-binding domain-containing protein [Myxococcales bacterium]
MLTAAPIRSVHDRILLLRSLDSLSGIDEAGLSLLAEHASRQVVPRGRIFETEGARLRRVNIVVEGRVEIQRRGRLVMIVERGRGVGFLSALAADEQGITARALEDCVMLSIPVEVLRTVYEENFSVVRRTLQVLAVSRLKVRGYLPADPRKPPPVELGDCPAGELTFVQRVMAARIGLFARANMDAVVDIARGSRQLRVPAGQLLWKQGDPAPTYLRLLYGRVQCTRDGGGQIEIGADWILGIFDGMSNQRRAYSVRALSDLVALEADYAALLSVFETHRVLAMQLLAGMARPLLLGEDEPDLEFS